MSLDWYCANCGHNNEYIRYWAKQLLKDNIKLDYSSKGIEIKWADGEISSTLACGLSGALWLKSHIIGN